jgi:hypothetical protein
MNIKYLTPLLLSGLLLSACDKMSSSNCSSEVAHKLIAKNIIETVEKKTASDKYSDTGEFIFDKAKIRASLDQLQIVVDSVRTTKEDPDSSKKFCSATLKVTIPTIMLSDTDEGRELEHKTKISEAARELKIDNSINVFTKKDFEYSVQPTDDGKELYVESENGIWVRLLHDITWSALLKPKLEEQKAAQDRQNVQEKQEVASLKQEAEVSKLEAEKLQALQEKQEADSLKQELLAKQAAIATEQSADNSQTQEKASLPVQATATIETPAPRTQPSHTEEMIVESYTARLSSKDHFNSDGVRLKLVADIIRQDRANYHKFNVRDNDDTGDNFFSDKDNRGRITVMLEKGHIDKATTQSILNGTPVVLVNIYNKYIEVYLQ